MKCYHCFTDYKKNIGIDINDGKYGTCEVCGYDDVRVWDAPKEDVVKNIPCFLLSNNLDSDNKNIAMLGTDKIIYIGNLKNKETMNLNIFAQFSLEELKTIVKNAEKQICGQSGK